MNNVPAGQRRRERRGASAVSKTVSVAVGLVVVATAIWLTVVLMQQARDQRFLDALHADPTTTIGELPDEQLLVSREGYCEDIARGMSANEVVEVAAGQWSGGDVTFAQYQANVRALYNAASVAC